MYMRKVFVLKMLLAEFLVINMRSYLVFIAQLIMMMYQNIEMLQGKKYYNNYGYPTSRDGITIFIGSVAGNANGKSWEYGAMTEIQERDEEE